jgi:hypothetical protein
MVTAEVELARRAYSSRSSSMRSPGNAGKSIPSCLPPYHTSSLGSSSVSGRAYSLDSVDTVVPNSLTAPIGSKLHERGNP